jgi:pimeloyl-ACP methyl ester carboxylesterase
MRRLVGCAVLLVFLSLGCAPLQGQRTEVVRRVGNDTIANSYRVHEPVGQPRGLLVMLPGYGSGVDGFEASSYTPSTLPARMAEQSILTIVAAPRVRTLYEVDEPLAVLDSIIDEVLERYTIPRDRVVIGGFSAGGTGAIRYAQICAAGLCRATSGVAGVFGVDPPLDFERMYREESLIIRRGAPRTNSAESQMILDTFRQAFGGSPEQVPEMYLRHSPMLASLPDGGNAKLLGDISVRLYTEPDVQWWIQNRGLDFYALNALDHAALINLLRVAGNTGAELIATSGKGFRPNGVRHPHSWSIVDEPDLARWIVRVMNRR